jgi:protein-S-isoprenylcysteine O-methyltransferase Ste14
MKLVNIRPPQMAWLLLALSVGLRLLLPPAYRHQFACFVWGIIPVGLGFGLMIWAWSLFRQSGTPIRPAERATALVSSGPFCSSRNPMYLGIVVMLLGIAVCVGSLPMLIAPAAFFAFMSLVFISFHSLRGGAVARGIRR